MKLEVNKVALFASGGSHVTIYQAEIEFLSGRTAVEVDTTAVREPGDVFPGTLSVAADGIRRGAERVLTPLGMGAVIRVNSITLHPVDFKPSKFERYTAEEIARLLAAGDDRDSD